MIPANTVRKYLSVILVCMIGWTCVHLATNVYRDYALGLFIWLPVVIGITSVLVYGYKNDEVNRKQLRNTAYLSLLVLCFGMLFFAWEGVICMIMAAPIGLFFTWIGFLIGYAIIKSTISNSAPLVIVTLFVSVPAFMAFENKDTNKETLKSVVTSVEINASPEVVWKNVVEFPELKAPEELIFKSGIAYPINAKIQGEGIGAIRYCNFSTGSFVEPITVWDKPNLLRFSVAAQPEPMKELSLYDIHPNHLHGYWVSKQGQFKLTRLPNGHTLLEGTTWYENRIRPDIYWSVWSNFIVHKIHSRVLAHIKEQSEQHL
ncbi:MAG: hypothetical protein JWQ38_2501 [Flavipsychrobacter sp.]|nr:hypothetical protein [Flavipsychrobacter sp.]